MLKLDNITISKCWLSFRIFQSVSAVGWLVAGVWVESGCWLELTGDIPIRLTQRIEIEKIWGDLQEQITTWFLYILTSATGLSGEFFKSKSCVISSSL